MRKLIAMLMTAMCAVSVSLAQETVTGVVVDKKGNPLPGVRIEVPGTPDHAISDLDGSFTLFRSDQSKKKVYATYAGMNPRKVKIKDGMRIKMKEYNWWTKKPDEWNWMVNAIFAVPNDPFFWDSKDRLFNPAYGLMVGRVKKWGYYVKGVTNTFGMKAKDPSDGGMGFYDKLKTTYWSVTAGGIIRLGCPIHLYGGVGYAEFTPYERSLRGDWYKNKEYQDSDFAFDLGLMLRIKHLSITIGYTCAPGDGGTAGNFGIGYSF